MANLQMFVHLLKVLNLYIKLKLVRLLRNVQNNS